MILISPASAPVHSLHIVPLQKSQGKPNSFPFSSLKTHGFCIYSSQLRLKVLYNLGKLQDRCGNVALGLLFAIQETTQYFSRIFTILRFQLKTLISQLICTPDYTPEYFLRFALPKITTILDFLSGST